MGKKPTKSAAPKRTRKADYDFYKSIGPKGGRRRRVPHIEKKSEEGILDQWKRAAGINLARDMFRNSAPVHGMLRSLRVNVIGIEGKLKFNRSEEWYAKAQNWFNQIWSKHADYVDGTSWRELQQLAVYALENEGDFVAVFDDGLLSGTEHGTGRIATWESDQIRDIDETGFAPWKARDFTQHNGVVCNGAGRVCGVIVSAERGSDPIPKEKALPFIYDTPEEFEASPVRLVGRKYRLRQLRGVANSIPTLQLTTDTYEMLGLELQSAKVSASRYASVIDPPDNTNGTTPGGYADLHDDDDAGDGTDGETAGDGDGADGDEPTPAEIAAAEAEKQLAQANALDDYTGGNVDYLDNGSQIIFDPTNRPNSQLPAFIDFVQDMAGASFGLNHSYSRMKADGSYTAYRGDLAMTWRTFEDLRKFLEGLFFDWVVRSAIEFAVETKALTAPPDADWFTVIAFTYPRPIAVDETKEAAAVEARLKAGLTTYRQELGPAWKETLAEIAEEKKFLHSIGLRHPQDETAAGIPLETEGDSDVENSQN